MIAHRRALWMVVVMFLAGIGCSGESKSSELDAATGPDQAAELDQAAAKPVTGNRFTATPEGGAFALSDTVVVTIPGGAVDEDTELEFNFLSSSELVEIFSPGGMTTENLLFGVDAKPDGIVFAKPITVSLTAVPLDPWDRLFVYEFDAESKTYSPAEIEFDYSLTEGTVDLFLTHFSGKAGTRDGPSDEAEREKKKEECEADCRCAAVKTKQKDREAMCTVGDCQLLETELKVEFPKCKNAPPETHYQRELTPGCHLGLELSAAKSTIEQGESTDVTARTHLGCALYPLEGETTTFSSSSLGSVSPGKDTTDKNGEATTVFTAGEDDGVATVTAKTTVTYPMSEMVASSEHPDIPGGTFTESSIGPLRTETEEKQIDIAIQTIEHWYVQGKATMSYSRNWPGAYHYVDWSVSGEADVAFRFEFERARLLAGESLELVVTGTGTQLASAVIDSFDSGSYASAEITNAYFPTTLIYDSIEVTGWADEDGDVAIFVHACVKPGAAACCDGDIYRYDITVCDFEMNCSSHVTDTTDFGCSCIAFGFGEPVKVIEGTYDGSGAFYGDSTTSTYEITLTQE